MNRTMKKTLLVCLIACTALLGGCSGKKKEVNVDIEALASKLATETVTSGSLTKTPADPVSIYFFDQDSYVSGVAYKSDGSIACEAAVIESSDEKGASAAEKKLQEHVDQQIELYSSYNAGEVDKLKNAVIQSAGKYTVLCVCDDAAKAKDIIKEAGF